MRLRKTRLKDTSIDAATTLLAGTAVATATAGFLADANRTHLFNPAWTPHAKFHDGWTLALASGIGTTSLYLLLVRRPAQPGLAAALLAEVWGAQLAAYAFPGAGGVARDFPDPSTRPLVARAPEWLVSTVMLALIGTGYRLRATALSRR
jgi:hypothetical protein